ncbi:MAG: hypothetical protein ABI634_03550 [Acidobacteriota bacterium]
MRFPRAGAVRTLVLLSFALWASPAGAQTLTYGAKGGLDLTRVHFGSSFAPDTGTSAGVVGGGFVAAMLAHRLVLRGEVLVANERAVFDSVITDTIRTLDVPILIRSRAWSLNGHAIDVSGGFVARWVLDATETVGGESSSIKGGIAKSNQAVAIGGSIGLLRHVTADVRYLQGLKGVYKKIGGGTEGRTRTVQVTLEYQF